MKMKDLKLLEEDGLLCEQVFEKLLSPKQFEEIFDAEVYRKRLFGWNADISYIDSRDISCLNLILIERDDDSFIDTLIRISNMLNKEEDILDRYWKVNYYIIVLDKRYDEQYESLGLIPVLWSDIL